jgi:hypothetical protein
MSTGPDQGFFERKKNPALPESEGHEHRGVQEDCDIIAIGPRGNPVLLPAGFVFLFIVCLTRDVFYGNMAIVDLIRLMTLERYHLSGKEHATAQQ